MKKLVFILAALFITLNCQALSLFPFFVDLVGNYKEGAVPEVQALEIDCLSSDKCNDFKTIKDADAFLNDVLPYSNYAILKKAAQKNGRNMQIYVSLMEDNRTSILGLVELPEGLYVVYDEAPGNPFGIE